MMLLRIVFFIPFLVIVTKSMSQSGRVDDPKNRFEVMLLGNRSLVSGIYSRAIANKKVSIFMANIGAGIIPGSHDKDTIPSVLQLGLGSSVELGGELNKLVLGTTYSAIMKLGQDKKNSETPNFYGGLVLDIGYVRYFRNSDTFIKLVFSPVLIGNDYKKNLNIPIGLSFGGTF